MSGWGSWSSSAYANREFVPKFNSADQGVQTTETIQAFKSMNFKDETPVESSGGFQPVYNNDNSNAFVDKDNGANDKSNSNEFNDKSNDFDDKNNEFNSADGEQGGGDDSCRNCGEIGHVSRECPQERKMTGECYNCGEVGHNKADCPNPKVDRPFTGTCRHCEKEGHRAAECPEKPAEKCRNCLQEGHKAAECTSNRAIDRSNVPDMDKASAWSMLEKAAKEKEMIEFQEALKIYLKGDDSLTYPALESLFRSSGLGVYLIALDKPIPQTMTNVDLQGKAGCKYTVGYFFKAKASRPMMLPFWPTSPEENLERLKDAGETLESAIPVCRNCNELGHMSKDCELEKIDAVEQVGIKCSNCSESGHRIRDCPKERAPRGGTCRNCNQPGHKASECTEERSAANVECRRCNEMGHFSKDCPSKGEGDSSGGCRNCGEEGHFAKECEKPRVMICRNCDEPGHASRECPKPRDYSRVKCNNCGEMGHTIVRCKQPVAQAENASEAGETAGGDYNAGGGGAWQSKSPPVSVGGW